MSVHTLQRCRLGFSINHGKRFFVVGFSAVCDGHGNSCRLGSEPMSQMTRRHAGGLLSGRMYTTSQKFGQTFLCNFSSFFFFIFYDFLHSRYMLKTSSIGAGHTVYYYAAKKKTKYAFYDTSEKLSLLTVWQGKSQKKKKKKPIEQTVPGGYSLSISCTDGWVEAVGTSDGPPTHQTAGIPIKPAVIWIFHFWRVWIVSWFANVPATTSENHISLLPM